MVPAGDAVFHRETTIHPELPAPGTTDLVESILASYARAIPALGYRFDTADGSLVFSGDTTVDDDLIALAQGADILVHQVAGREIELE